MNRPTDRSPHRFARGKPKREKGSVRGGAKPQGPIRDPKPPAERRPAPSRPATTDRPAAQGRAGAQDRPGAQDVAATAQGAAGAGAGTGTRTGAGAGAGTQAGPGARTGAGPRAAARPDAVAPPAAPVEVLPPERPHEPDYASSGWNDDPLSEGQQAARAAAVAAGSFRCGQAVLAGQPNAGKSTLLNRLLGEKLAIVSPKPQTTRDNLRGILTTAQAQVIFLDTPGIHRARTPLNRAMVGQAVEALETVDVVVLVIDAPKAVRWAERAQAKAAAPIVASESDPDDAEDQDDEAGTAGSPKAERVFLDPAIHPGDRRVIREVLRHNQKWMVALNKTDVVRPRHLLPLMQALATAPGVGPIVPVSAWTADGLRALVQEIVRFMPEGEPEFEADELTDRPLRFLAAELVREQVFLQIRDEVPYGVVCETELWEELTDLTHIQVLVHVEKPAQRAILIGRQGVRMKALATAARLQIERLTGRKAFLEVHVRVEPNWPERLEKLRDFGYLT